MKYLNQEDWKRTQVRMPQDLYVVVSNYAKEHNLSLNSAMLILMEQGLKPTDDNQEQIKYLKQQLVNLYEQSSENARQARDMRQIMIEIINRNFEHMPLGLRSKYGILLNVLLYDMENSITDKNFRQKQADEWKQEHDELLKQFGYVDE